MDIQWLREFLALSKTLNYRACAEKLFISQSTLSKHISAIEQELGAQLFVRDTKSVRLTEEGRLFNDSVRLIVREYDAIVEQISGVHAVHGTLRIGAGVRYPDINKRIEPAVAAFEAKYPDVEVFIDDIQWEDYRERLLKGVFDVVFSAKFPGMNDEGLELFTLSTVPLCIWVSDTCAIPAEKQVVTLQELTDMGLRLRVLNIERSQEYMSFLRGLFREKNLKVCIGRPLSQAFAMDSHSFTITPKFDPSAYFGIGLRTIDLADSPETEIVIARKKKISNSVAVLFYEEFKNMFLEDSTS